MKIVLERLPLSFMFRFSKLNQLDPVPWNRKIPGTFFILIQSEIIVKYVTSRHGVNDLINGCSCQISHGSKKTYSFEIPDKFDFLHTHCRYTGC